MRSRKEMRGGGPHAENFWCEGGEAKLRAKGMTRIIGAQKPLVREKKRPATRMLIEGK